ncbi:lazarillo protein [Culex quinquefasciatus]|uniref:lazarillo protein n=1 Tax=Culex quinquefasciatus TaxID=7176 RepID=UPI0018E343CC|nr:lazarillo protein [Culex quinquefasciatus]
MTYMGTWYEIQRYPHRNQPNGDCVVVNYALNQTSGEVAILNRMRVLADDATVEARGTAVTDPEYPGQGVLRVRFEETPPEVPASYYRILGVVYDRYAVVWSCRENGANSVESAWVLSRAPTLEGVSVSIVKAIIDQHLDHDSFTITKQGEQYCGGVAALTTSIVVFILSVFVMLQ